jgi:hypothetical protein
MWRKLIRIISPILAKEQILTLTVSAIALAVAVRSCIVSERSASLAEYEVSAQRLITLTADTDNDKDILKIKPTDDNLMLLRASVHYPQVFDPREWPIDPPDHSLYVTVAKNHLRESLGKAFPPDPKYHQLIPDAAVPVIINSEYIAKGVKHFDRSLYWINYRALISGDKFRLPEITFKGLLFQGHLAPSENAAELLSRIWKRIEQDRKELMQQKNNVESGRGE